MLVVLAVTCAALIVAVTVKTRDEAAAAARAAAEYRPPALSSASPASPDTVVAIISDEAALRAGSSVGAAQRWPEALRGAVGADVTLLASPGGGYAAAGDDGRTFVESAARVPADADVVLFVGGASDSEVPSLSLARAATQAFSAAAQTAPDAVIIAVGPIFRPSGTSKADLDGVRATLHSAAEIAGLRWVDPVASRWVTGASATDDLSAAKESTITARLEAVIEAEERSAGD